MYRCLKHISTDSEELTYKTGFTNINYPFDAASTDSGSLRLSSAGSEAIPPKIIKEAPNNVSSQPNPKVVDKSTIADRCRIGIGGRDNAIYYEGHGNGHKYRPTGRK